jgi:mRNA interferase MazF
MTPNGATMAGENQKPPEDEKPPRVQPRITAAPKIRQVYWCDFWKDAQLPEIWKTRPALVVSYKHTLFGLCMVIPLSTTPHPETDTWAVKMAHQINGVQSWALCNMPSTVATSRLSQWGGEIPFMPKDDFNKVLERLTKWLPKPFPLEN